MEEKQRPGVDEAIQGQSAIRGSRMLLVLGGGKWASPLNTWRLPMLGARKIASELPTPHVGTGF
jgi:hypothetical protein